MFSRCQQGAVKKEVCATPLEPENEEIPEARLVSSFKAAEAEEDDIYHLSEKPFFHVLLGKSHVERPFTLNLPTCVLSVLPHATVPVVLRHGHKNWKLSYIGNSKRPRFDAKWKTFATENHLKHGDACVFELMDLSGRNFRFKVHILRGDLPPELDAMVDSCGKTPETAIVVD